MRWLTSLVVLVGLGIGRSTVAQPGTDPSQEVVLKIQKFYDATRDLHARFEQVIQSTVGGAKKASGEVWLQKPGKMRWSYDKPEKKLMVADGQTLWVYEPEDEQAFKQDLRASSLPVSVSFLFGQGKLSDEFEVSIVHPSDLGKPGDVVLKLIPRTATAAYRYLLFDVDAKTGLVRETLVYDQQGGTNHLSFSAVEINKSFDASRFHFSPPAGTRIVSAGSSPPAGAPTSSEHKGTTPSR